MSEEKEAIDYALLVARAYQAFEREILGVKQGMLAVECLLLNAVMAAHHRRLIEHLRASWEKAGVPAEVQARLREIEETVYGQMLVMKGLKEPEIRKL